MPAIEIQPPNQARLAHPRRSQAALLQHCSLGRAVKDYFALLIWMMSIYLPKMKRFIEDVRIDLATKLWHLC